jgi:putative nucleotidyltransferase with HDIG domain
MEEKLMNRQEALAFLREHLKKENLIKHCLAVEACMRAFAGKFGEDEEKWGLAGLLHDVDYEYTAKDPERHALKSAEMLEQFDLGDDVLHAIKAHNHKVEIESDIDAALLATDPATGFIVACALMHPEKKLKPLDLRFLKKRFKEKSFAKGASREQMKECSRMGIELDDFLSTCLSAMQQVDTDLGL